MQGRYRGTSDNQGQITSLDPYVAVAVTVVDIGQVGMLYSTVGVSPFVGATSKHDSHCLPSLFAAQQAQQAQQAQAQQPSSCPGG